MRALVLGLGIDARFKTRSAILGRPGWGNVFGWRAINAASFYAGGVGACRDAYIHTAVETSAYIESGAFLELMKFVDWAFIDIKHMDPEKHKIGTGVSNELILSNIALLARSGWSGRLIIRMPVIPGFNDDDENILKTAEFLRQVGLVEMNILPFHRLGDSKWSQLGEVYPYRDYEGTPEEKMAHLQRLLLDQQIACYVGSETPF